MKSLIFMIPAIFVNIYVYSQNWYQLGTHWYYNRERLGDYPAHGYIHYYVEKDTTLDFFDAKMIIASDYKYTGSIRSIDTLYFREDNHKVFKWDGSEFNLMYDLNLNPGDTLLVDIVKNQCDSVFSYNC